MDHNLAKAFDHPTRAEIVEALAEGAATPRQLASALERGLSTISYHLTTLHQLRCIAVAKTEHRRGAIEREYELVPPASTGYIPRQHVPPPFRGYASGAVLQRIMDSGVRALAAGTLEARDDSQLMCLSVALDVQGRSEADELMRDARTRLAAILARNTCRLAKAKAPGTPATVVLANFESAGEGCGDGDA